MRAPRSISFVAGYAELRECGGAQALPTF